MGSCWLRLLQTRSFSSVMGFCRPLNINLSFWFHESRSHISMTREPYNAATISPPRKPRRSSGPVIDEHVALLECVAS